MLKSASLKTALRNRTHVFGAWTSLGHPSITEMFSQTGVDFVGIDIEHSTISLEQCQRIIAASQANGTFCLPRIASHNMEMIKRLLDSGADGIILPMVSTPQEVENLIKWTKYPPVGQRSYGINRGQNYGFNFTDYTKQWNESSSLIIQIESLEGVKNVDHLLQHEEIDGVMIGPYDMSGSMGIPGELEHPRVLEACDTVIRACRKYGKACGTQITEPDSANVQARFEAGYTFIVLSSDIFLLWKWGEKMRGLISESKLK